MHLLKKVILSIPSIIGLAYIFTFFNPKSIAWISNNIVDFEYQGPIVNISILIQIGYLIFRLWRYKNLKKSIKTNWTILLILFNSITSLIYIWKKDDEFLELNNKHSA